jgi:hypothetical protein
MGSDQCFIFWRIFAIYRQRNWDNFGGFFFQVTNWTNFAKFFGLNLANVSI